MKWLIAVILSSTVACTAVFPLVTASTIAVHNNVETDQWHYQAPTITAVVVGLITDLALITYWIKNMPGARD